MSKIPLTVKGAELMRAELHQLKTVERPKVIASIQEARTHGDLSENAEYDAAKERQSFIEGRIVELEGKLANAQIIDPAHVDADGRCVFGATVELEEVGSGEPVTYQIVGDDEADIKSGKISISSPPACACPRAAGCSSACATPTSPRWSRSRARLRRWDARCLPPAARRPRLPGRGCRSPR